MHSEFPSLAFQYLKGHMFFGLFFIHMSLHLSEIVAQSICLVTEVKRQWAMLVLGWVTVSVQDQLWDVSKLEFLSVKTFVNSSALLVSLIAVRSH